MKEAEIIHRIIPDDFRYIYLKYIDTWHIKPSTFDDLFDFVDFMTVEGKLGVFRRAMQQISKGA